MWQVFYIIKEAFFRDAADYFAGRKKQKENICKIRVVLLLRNHELPT